MLALLFGYDSGVVWFNYLAEICVGTIVVAALAAVVWWLRTETWYTSGDRKQVKETLQDVQVALDARPTRVEKNPSPFRKSRHSAKTASTAVNSRDTIDTGTA